MASYLVGAPSRNAMERGPQHIFLFMPFEETISIKAFVHPLRNRFPQVNSIVQYEYGSEGEFELDSTGQEALLKDIELLVSHIIKQQKSFAAKNQLREYTKWAHSINPTYRLDGLSVRAALLGLERLKKFINEIKRREWLLFGVND